MSLLTTVDNSSPYSLLDLCGVLWGRGLEVATCGETTLVEWKINNMLTHSLCPNLKELECSIALLSRKQSCVELQLSLLTSYEHCSFLTVAFLVNITSPHDMVGYKW